MVFELVDFDGDDNIGGVIGGFLFDEDEDIDNKRVWNFSVWIGVLDEKVVVI